MSQKQGDAQLKNEGEKKKEKSIVTWHDIKCERSGKKKQGECVSVQFQQDEKKRKDVLFGP